MATKKNMGGKVAMGAGALAVAAAAAAAGYYFYASKDAKKNRKIAAKWASGLQKEAVKQAKKIGAASQADVMKAVSAATAAYEGVKSIDTKQLAHAAKELKDNWKEIVVEVGSSGGKKAAKKSAKKSARRAIKRAK